MQFELKPISRDAVSDALRKAERYRLLNEPAQAESICLDILAVDPGNREAAAALLLARTDQFGHGVSPAKAREVLRQMDGEYERAYYGGIVWERSAHAQLRSGSPNAVFTAYEALREAMQCYEQAESLRPVGNDDALLRWNSCARFLMRNPNLRPRPDEAYEAVSSE